MYVDEINVFNSLASIIGYLFTIGSSLSCAVRGLLDLTGEGFGHLGGLGWLWFMIPEFLFVGAGHVRNNELDILLYQLALLPRDRFTLVCTSPYLLSILIRLP